MDYQQFSPRTENFEFRGDTYEWLGVWIVNLFLSIVTVGIYSAWAKVRMRKYFYQHTYVVGRNFDYHATGMQIFIGRVIVIVGLIALSLLSAIPAIGILITIAFLVLFPWLIVRALQFNAVMSSWSNVRFGFDGKGWRAFLVFLFYPFLTAFTAYLAWPFADRARRRFTTSNHRLGAAPFRFDAPIGPFYKAVLAAVAWVLLVGLLLGIAAIEPIRQVLANPDQPDPGAAVFIPLLIYAFIFIAIFPAATVYQAMIRNTVFNGATLDGVHRFHSDVRPMRVMWIVISNAVMVAMSVGLMIPWAQIRMARYNAPHTRLLPGGSLDEFAGQLEARTTALGDAYADIDGIDIGLPI